MRYVLLKHKNGDDFHVDFLLDCGGERLLSWQIDDEKFAGSLVSCVKFFILAEQSKQTTDTINTVCQRIFDHRRLYLDYEGEISENRGHVTRIEWGQWDISATNGRQITLTTIGRHIAQNAITVKRWQFRPPENFVIDTQNLSVQNLMQKLPLPGHVKWHLCCVLV
jgi:hypothetical protein